MTTYKNILPKATVDVEKLNDIFTPLTFEERIRHLYRYFRQEDVLYTSSFGTKSVFLLHLIASIRPNQIVHFIDTGYNFPQTLEYKQQLTELLHLNVKELTPDPSLHQFTLEEKSWDTAPDLCCNINKVMALEPVKEKHRVWISGLMSYQTNYRSELKIFEEQDGILKFHPLIDLDEGEFLYHLSYHKLPHHPLEAMGYGSIGCTHCTNKGKGRDGRWKGKTKTECGLHPS